MKLEVEAEMLQTWEICYFLAGLIYPAFAAVPNYFVSN